MNIKDLAQFKVRAWDNNLNKMVYTDLSQGGKWITEDGFVACAIESPYAQMNLSDPMRTSGFFSRDDVEVYEGDFIDFAGLKPIELIAVNQKVQDSLGNFNFTPEGMKAFAVVIGNIYATPYLKGKMIWDK